jgi:hypothetical protein
VGCGCWVGLLGGSEEEIVDRGSAREPSVVAGSSVPIGFSVRLGAKTEHRSFQNLKPKPNRKTNSSVRFRFGLVQGSVFGLKVPSLNARPLRDVVEPAKAAIALLWALLGPLIPACGPVIRRMTV